MTENLIPVGKFDTTRFVKIAKFCANMETLEVKAFATVAEVEKHVKNKIIGKL